MIKLNSNLAKAKEENKQKTLSCWKKAVKELTLKITKVRVKRVLRKVLKKIKILRTLVMRSNPLTFYFYNYRSKFIKILIQKIFKLFKNL